MTPCQPPTLNPPDKTTTSPTLLLSWENNLDPASTATLTMYEDGTLSDPDIGTLTSTAENTGALRVRVLGSGIQLGLVRLG